MEAGSLERLCGSPHRHTLRISWCEMEKECAEVETDRDPTAILHLWLPRVLPTPLACWPKMSPVLPCWQWARPASMVEGL